MAQADIRFPKWLLYLTGFLLFLNAGNACPADLEANWEGEIRAYLYCKPDPDSTPFSPGGP